MRSLEFKEEEVHGFAEEMEHVLTDELDYAITQMLDNPHYDPHNKLIPEKPQTMEEL
ncbi:ABC transporter, membrane permease [Chlamydia abortus]|nr:ABC transporter, membrane permease [Chlamydia abortus]